MATSWWPGRHRLPLMGQHAFAVARFNANGQLDTTFGTGGLVLTTPAGIFPSATALILQPNGQILVGGFMAGVNKDKSGRDGTGALQLQR